MHQQNIHDMYTAVETNHGFDVIIIVSSSSDQAEFWQQRLRATSSSVIGHKTRVISVEEDWAGGAGQLLGTLYAWNKANTIFDLNRMLETGGTVAMYHTAGKGTRMAPIPAAEANNKSAIKLPRLIEILGLKIPFTILEAVIFQTGIFAASRPGRLCVFWGDQVFIPSKKVEFAGSYHAEILDIRAEIPSDEDFWKRDWQSYGLIIPTESGEALQREKQKWDELQGLINTGTARPDASGRITLGKSLGCFTVSYDLLAALLGEFAKELNHKQGKLDTDPHLWMPLTSESGDFVLRGGDPIYWDRLNRFKEKVLAQSEQGFKLFGDKDIGADTLWWDYGQVKIYHQNFLKALDDSFEGECLRQFYDLEKHWIKNSESDGTKIENSILIDTQARGTIKNCVLLGSRANGISVSNSVIVNSVLSQIQADRALIYNCTHLTDTELPSGEVVTDLFLSPESRIRMKTNLSRDGKEDWEKVLSENPYSFAQLAQLVEKAK